MSQSVPILFSPHLTLSCEDAVTMGTHNPLICFHQSEHHYVCDIFLLSHLHGENLSYPALLNNKATGKREIGFAPSHSSRTRSWDCSPEAHGSSVIRIHRYCKLNCAHCCPWSSLMNTRCTNACCDLWTCPPKSLSKTIKSKALAGCQDSSGPCLPLPVYDHSPAHVSWMKSSESLWCSHLISKYLVLLM